jgi:hypothetical protein
MAGAYHQTWHSSMVAGGLALALLSGYVLAVLMQPAVAPTEAWDDGDHDEHDEHEAAEGATARH